MKSIRARLGLLLVLFFLLIAVSVGATYWGLEAQAEDALMINLAGRQRMLVQQMTRLAAEARMTGVTDEALSAAEESFAETLCAFQSGGQVRYPRETWVAVSAVREAEIRQQIGQVEQEWNVFRLAMQDYLSIPGDGDRDGAALRELSAELVAEADHTVRLLQDASRARVQRIRALQAAFFVAALILLGAGSLLIQGNILAPLKRLGWSAERIRSGDLSTPVAGGGPTEIHLLSRTFESMRLELETSHDELARWAQTLEEKVKERTRELDALYMVSQEISARLDRKDVLNSITAKASELLQSEVAFLCLLEPDKDLLALQAIAGPAETVRQLSSRADNPFVQAILQGPGGRNCKAHGCLGTCGILDERYKASHLAASLVVEGRVIGALCVGDRQEDRFSEDAPALLSRLASAAAVAIENARLYEQAERLAMLEERQRIAAAMHDGLAQALYAQGLMLEQVGEQLGSGEVETAGHLLDRARKNLEQASTEVRRSIANLQDEPFRQKTIQELLADLVQQQAREGGCRIDWQAELDGSLILPTEEARQVAGIAQEALANARRHSGASRVTIRLAQAGGQARLTIEDDGRGFDPTTPPADGRRRFGLKILAARAAQLGGQFFLDSAPGRGTRVSLTWPVKEQAAALVSGRLEAR